MQQFPFGLIINNKERKNKMKTLILTMMIFTAFIVVAKADDASDQAAAQAQAQAQAQAAAQA